MRLFQTILNPAVYHGHRKRPPFFEGWYFKLISADHSHKNAIIPGVFLGKDGYAFIQVLHGITGEVEFIKYPLESFSATEDEFIVEIDKNIFQLNHLHLDIDSQNTRIQGELQFDDVIGWPITVASPGVMGWYSWVPKMECYHGVLGFDHHISGSLSINGSNIDFTDGRGYIEKDWGTAFPEGYVWIQTNHFDQPKVSLTASIAIIPWQWSAFRGFIVGLWLGGELFRFATYTGAKTDLLEITDSEVIWFMSDKDYCLEIYAERGKTGDLKGPTRQDMGMRVAESLAGLVHVKLYTVEGKVIFEDVGQHAGLEVAGDIEKLLNSD
jgi:hypothetical protein